MSSLLVSGGQLVDELSVRRADLLIQDGRVAAVLPAHHARTADDVLDVTGLHILPGVVDGHVHFNEPGRTDWEGFLTGTTAAAAVLMWTKCSRARES